MIAMLLNSCNKIWKKDGKKGIYIKKSKDRALK
jgi:hypothetical protein